MSADKQSKEFFPWWDTLWNSLMEQRRQGRLPHGLLITGPDGLGKGSFARTMALSLLCSNQGPDGHACEGCPSCLLALAGSNPDFMGVFPLEDGKDLKIDQIREISAKLSLKSHGGVYKVAIVNPAERMTPGAANALLKTLEEPTDNTILLLVSENPARLPATIRSRCHRIRLDPPATSQGLEWLETHGVTQDGSMLLRLASGSPLRALQFANDNILELRKRRWDQLEELAMGKADPLTTAEEWSKEGSTTFIGWMSDWLMDMIRIKFTTDITVLASPDLQESLRSVTNRLDSRTLFRLLDGSIEAHRLMSTPVNQRLLVEEQLIGWTAATNQ